jgi:hypothetical protein
MRRYKRCAFATALLVVSAAGALPLLTSSSFSDTTDSGGNSISARADWTAPTVPAAAIAKTAGGTAGFVKKSGTYHVYAAASDSGAPASGISTVKADVSSITTGQTAVSLIAGSYSAGGVAYGYRSAQLTAKSTLATGQVPFSVTATDGVAGVTTAGFAITGDSTAPTASAVQATNGSGGTVGKPELGDTLTLTYSEPADPASLLVGWDGTTTDVVLVFNNGDGAGGDYLQVYSTGLVMRPLGTVYLNRPDVVFGSQVAFGYPGVGTRTSMTQSGSAVSIVLGTPTGAVGTAGAAAVMTWTPSTGATDRAGNAASATTRSESGTSDKDF